MYKGLVSWAEHVDYLVCANCGYSKHLRCAGCSENFKPNEKLVCKELRHRHLECEFPTEDEV